MAQGYKVAHLCSTFLWNQGSLANQVSQAIRKLATIQNPGKCSQDIFTHSLCHTKQKQPTDRSPIEINFLIKCPTKNLSK